MSYTIKTIKTRPSVDVSFVSIDHDGPAEPNESAELSEDGLTKTTTFLSEDRPLTVLDLPDMILPENDLKHIEHMKANGITRRIIIIDNSTNEIIQDFYDVP